MQENAKVIEMYENIWGPYLRFIQSYIQNNEISLSNYLKFEKELEHFHVILHNKELRGAVEWDGEFWDRETALRDGVNEYQQMGFNSKTFWAPRLGAHGIWKHLITPYLMNHTFRRPRMFVDLGCGVGEFVFSIHSEMLCENSKYVGLDNSSTAIEVARLRATLLNGEERRPEFSFRVTDINDLGKNSIQCHGMDVVLYTVSALNKISNIRKDYYDMILSALVDSGSVNIIHVETSGWQVCLNPSLRDFYVGLGSAVQGSLDISAVVENQQKSVIERGGNVNLMDVVKRAQTSGRAKIVNVFMNYFMPNPGASYSITHLKLKTSVGSRPLIS